MDLSLFSKRGGIVFAFLLGASLMVGCRTQPATQTKVPPRSGNPVFPGWYADPEGAVFGKKFWIYPTYSAPYNEQVFLDAFSSPDLVQWTKHRRILDTNAVSWAWRAMWAPAIVKNGGKYFLFFGANDIQNNEAVGGIGVAVADKPEGPFKDYLGKPLIDRFHNGAQPIDQFVFHDQDGQYYLIYGGWRHCNIARLKPDFTRLRAVRRRHGVQGDHAAGLRGRAVHVHPRRQVLLHVVRRRLDRARTTRWPMPSPIHRSALSSESGRFSSRIPQVATGAGHHSVIQLPGKDDILHRVSPPSLG